MEPPATGSGYYLFGRDIMSIPCLRPSLLTGFASSIGLSLVHFLFTSNGTKSFKIGQASFFVVTFPYWYICREKRYSDEKTIREAEKSIKKAQAEEYIITDSLELEFSPDTYG